MFNKNRSYTYTTFTYYRKHRHLRSLPCSLPPNMPPSTGSPQLTPGPPHSGHSRCRSLTEPPQVPPLQTPCPGFTGNKRAAPPPRALTRYRTPNDAVQGSGRTQAQRTGGASSVGREQHTDLNVNCRMRFNICSLVRWCLLSVPRK